MKRTVVEITVDNISAIEGERDYSFDFTVTVDGKMVLNDTYQDDFDGDAEGMVHSLENGLAESLVMERHMQELFEPNELDEDFEARSAT